MLNAPNQELPVYGLLVNGREFVFVKLEHRETPIYARSFALSIERGSDLIQVFRILEYIRQEIIENES